MHSRVYGVALTGITVSLDTHPAYALLEISLQDVEAEVRLCGTVTPDTKLPCAGSEAAVFWKQPAFPLSLERCWLPTYTTNHHLTLKGGENRGNYTTQ